jgi:O-antigen/teichoic acid export membrane protein
MNPKSGSNKISASNNIFSKIKVLLEKLYKSDYFAKVAETFTTRILLILLSLVTGIIIARTLGPEGRGTFAIAMVIGTMGVQFTNIGIHSSNTHYVARDPKLLGPLLGNSLLISFSFGVLAAGIGWIMFVLFPQLSPIKDNLLLLSLIWIPFGLAYLFLQNLLIGLQEFRTFNKIELGAKIFNISLLGALILLDSVSPTTIFAAALLTLPFSFIYSFIKLAKHLKNKITCSIQAFTLALPYGLKAYIGSLLWYLLLRIDLFMVNDILGEGSTGLYDVAFNMSEIFYILPSVIGMVLFPKLSAINNVKEKWILARKVGIGMLVTLVIMSILSTILAESIIGVLFGEAFIAATSVFILLMVGKVIISINSIFSFFVASIHVPLLSVPFNIALVILNIGLNLILIEKFGMEGAAISSIICFGLLIPFHMYYSFKYIRNPETSIK